MAENTGILSINMTRQARNQGVVNRAIAHLKIFTCLVIRYNKFQQFCPPKIVQVTNILPSPRKFQLVATLDSITRNVFIDSFGSTATRAGFTD